MRFYLVFYSSDSGAREDFNVFYSWLTQASSRREAIAKVAKHIGEDASRLGAELMKLIP